MENKGYEKLIGVRNGFFLGDKYRLDLSWDKVDYPKKGVCTLINAKLSGPALQFAEKIQDNNHITLDFCKQYFVLINNMYLGKLSWGTVEYLNEGTVKLYDCSITHDTELNKVPNLNNQDKLVIDTSGHDAEVHAFNPVYNTYVTNVDWQVYNFTNG